jgi:hypothetical protein
MENEKNLKDVHGKSQLMDANSIGNQVSEITNDLLLLSASTGHTALVEEYAKIKAEVKALRGMQSGLLVITKSNKLSKKYTELLKDTETQLNTLEIKNKVYSHVIGLSRIIHNIEPPKRTKKTDSVNEE